MSEAKIAGRRPAVVALEAGSYFWCSCGESANQPHCDGAHKQGTEFKPVRFEVEEPRKAALCLCKHTANAPFCDGAHTKLPEE